jgi:6-phosphogluconolactonase
LGIVVMARKAPLLSFGVSVLAGVLALLAGCSDSGNPPTAPTEPPFLIENQGGVYTMTNGVLENRVIAFRRATNGSLDRIGSFPTGGRGIGGGLDPLQSQYSLVIDDSHRFLFAVNPGSDEVSVFRINPSGSLQLLGSQPTGGDMPISLAFRGQSLFVLNAGDNTVTGFSVSLTGRLIRRDLVSLAAGAAGASTIHFDSDGGRLIVTERDANRIETIPVNLSHFVGRPVVSASRGDVPFGFDVAPGNLVVVTEALGANPNGAISSYRLTPPDTLQAVTPSANAGGSATCWLVLTSQGTGFATNTGTHTVVSISLTGAGLLNVLNASAGATGPGSYPIDLDLTTNEDFLYVLQGTGDIRTFRVTGAALTDLGPTPAGPAFSGMQGLAAW